MLFEYSIYPYLALFIVSERSGDSDRDKVVGRVGACEGEKLKKLKPWKRHANKTLATKVVFFLTCFHLLTKRESSLHAMGLWFERQVEGQREIV